MSWTRSNTPFAAFKAAAEGDQGVNQPTQFSFTVWELSNEYPNGYWHPTTTDLNGLKKACELRIVYAPLDLPRRATRDAFIDLFQVLGIPEAFTSERVQSVSHSFGATTDSEGSITWFHFLCKLVRISFEPQVTDKVSRIAYHSDADPAIRGRANTGQAQNTASTELRPLPQADYSYLRSGFFLRTTPAGSPTLACFGPTPKVKSRIDQFIESKAWTDVANEPYILFDIVLEGLFLEIDENVWNMNTLFGPLEHQTLENANSTTRTTIPKTVFVELHNLAKHIIYLHEAIQSGLLLTGGLLSRLKVVEPKAVPTLQKTRSTGNATTLTPDNVRQQLRDSLEYRRSLFESTSLRLASLQKRIENAITLSFNLVTQQDSLVMIQDSSSMKIIAAITMIFLPTTAVTGIVGSQLFLSSYSDTDGTWTVLRTPLFAWLWWLAVPLTMIVVILGWAWWKYARPDNLQGRTQLLKKLTFPPLTTSMSSKV